MSKAQRFVAGPGDVAAASAPSAVVAAVAADASAVDARATGSSARSAEAAQAHAGAAASATTVAVTGPRAQGDALVAKSDAAAAATTAGAPPAAPRSVLVCVWRCMTCGNDCNVVRGENRCICGHRCKEHEMGRGPDKARCRAPGCKCRNMFYVFGEGSFLLRCRCKHRTIEHDPNPPRACAKPGCGSKCTGFDSPFVCNCAHGWAAHQQVWEMRQLKSLPQLDEFGDPALVRRGLDDNGDAFA